MDGAVEGPRRQQYSSAFVAQPGPSSKVGYSAAQLLDMRRAFKRELRRVRSERSLYVHLQLAHLAFEPYYLRRRLPSLSKIVRTGLRELIGVPDIRPGRPRRMSKQRKWVEFLIAATGGRSFSLSGCRTGLLNSCSDRDVRDLLYFENWHRNDSCLGTNPCGRALDHRARGRARRRGGAPLGVRTITPTTRASTDARRLCRGRHAVSVPHATAALHLALAALGVGPGKEVIAPDATWIASVAPIVYVGAEPVLVDILAEPGASIPTPSRPRSDRRPRRSSASISTARPAIGIGFKRSPTVTASR